MVGQLLAVAIVFFLLRWLWGNLVANLDRLDIPLDFGFLGRPTQFQIPNDPTFDPRSPVIEMVWVGVKNTFLAGFFGILLASVVGLLVGIARLSDNWLVAKLASGYVEFFRNIPPLVIIVFFAFAVFTFGPLPILREAIEVRVPGTSTNLLLLSNDRWGIPSFKSTGDLTWFGAGALVTVVLAAMVWSWRTRVHEATGVPSRRLAWTGGSLLVGTVVAYLVSGGPFVVDWPALSENGRVIASGFAMNWGFMSVTGALGLYTASHIAEIIRGSILAVHGGQTEAANALALNGLQRYRFVVLPQALRIALPPYINQCLNLVKNTSLAAAVAYAEITNLTQSSIGNGRPALQSIAVLMGVYLAFSLVISVILNSVNRRFQLVTR